MTDLPKYHLREQQADALLQPMLATVRELERRAQHYLDRINLATADYEAVNAAHAALGTARAEIDRLWRERAARVDATLLGEKRG